VVPVAAVAFSLTQPVRYAATARVLLNTPNLASSLNASAPSQVAPDPPDRIAETQAELARVSSVVRPALRNPHAAGMSVQSFLSASSVSPGSNADLLSFTVTAGSPEAAQALATAYARAFTAYRHTLDTAALRQARIGLGTQLAELRAEGRKGSSLYATLVTKDEQLQSQEALQTSNATLVQAAATATQVQPMTTRNAVLGIGLGLLLGVALAFLRQAIDARVVTAAEVSAGLGLPLLGRLWTAPRSVRRQVTLVTVAEPSGALAQAYRVLRTTLDSVMPRRLDAARETANLIAVTSATAGEGRSTTVANLGVAFARSGRRVALVNADMRPALDERRTSLDGLFGLDLRLGLADVIRGRATLDTALVFADATPAGEPADDNGSEPEADEAVPAASPAGVWVLPAGSPSLDLGDPATAARMDDVLKDLAARVDIVLIDSPPLLVSADALELVGLVDAAVVVVRANRITRPALAELARLLTSSPVYKMGFVLTDADEDRHVYSRRRLVLTPLPSGLQT
jgi:Mrp family chromosome partitioning ATPase